jgi:hypothetical protein
MATGDGQGKGGGRPWSLEAMDIVDSRHRAVIMMRLQENKSFQEIAGAVKLTDRRCRQIVSEYRDRARAQFDFNEYHRRTVNDVENTLDLLRPVVLSEPSPPDVLYATKDPFGEWWAGLKARRELHGLDAPKRTHITTEDLTETNEEAAEYLARLAIWARNQNAINAQGYQPALPPGMTERVTPVSSNGHGKVHGSSMWSLAVEFPSED